MHGGSLSVFAYSNPVIWLDLTYAEPTDDTY